MLQKIGQKKVILPLTIIFLINMVLFSIPGFPGSRPVILSSAGGLNIPDMMGIYSPEEVYHFLDTIGAEGRSAYQTMHFATDLVFPLIYGALLFSSLCWATHKAQSKTQWLPFVAVFPTLVDLAENFTLVFITNRFPDFLPGWTRAAQVFTILKFTGISVSFIALIVLVIKKKASSGKQAQ